jgi:hypothetical protein
MRPAHYIMLSSGKSNVGRYFNGFQSPFVAAGSLIKNLPDVLQPLGCFFINHNLPEF